MAYDENLAQRVREIMAAEETVTERKMFGGLAFMLDGNMACGILGEDLMLRLGPDGGESALASTHVQPMDFTGRPMKGMVFVSPAGLKGSTLRRWVEKSVAFASGLPPKGGTPLSKTR